MITNVKIHDAARIKRIKSGVSSFDFSPGVTVIVGANGSGKTTLLECITQKKQAGGKLEETEVTVTQTENSPKHIVYSSEFDGLKQIPYFDYEKDMTLQVQAMFMSRGQAQIHKFAQTVKSLKDGFSGTVILDEPDSCLDTVAISTLLNVFLHFRTQCQIIMSAHSPILMFRPEFNYIEVEPDYRNKCRAALKKSCFFTEETPL